MRAAILEVDEVWHKRGSLAGPIRRLKRGGGASMLLCRLKAVQ